VALDGRMTECMVIGKELEGTGRGLVEVRAHNLHGCAEEKT
jgi:hypothetical protein